MAPAQSRPSLVSRRRPALAATAAVGLAAAGGASTFLTPSAGGLRGGPSARAATSSQETEGHRHARQGQFPMNTVAFMGATLASMNALIALGQRGSARSSAQASAAAEAPAPTPFNPAKQIGAVAPLGYFDPLNFAKVGDEKGFRELRAAEIKHGRVAMMASIGALGQHFIKFPGFEKVTGTFGAANSGPGTLGMVLLFCASGVMELAWREDQNTDPGNFGDPFGVNMYTEEMREKEISNGRMAMISMLGIWAAELATGKDAIEQFGLSALPAVSIARGGSRFTGSSASAPSRVRSRALGATATAEVEVPPPFTPAEQIGAVAPLGFFDPLGFTKVGDEAGFRNLRAAEIKHGRVAMMASIGALGQHFIKFPGFEKVTGTFGAANSGPGTLGLVLLFCASGILELAWREEPSKDPGNYGDPFGVKMYTQEMREKEISNGRMAMISVFGIWAAELATGKDAIEQFGL